MGLRHTQQRKKLAGKSRKKLARPRFSHYARSGEWGDGSGRARTGTMRVLEVNWVDWIKTKCVLNGRIRREERAMRARWRFSRRVDEQHSHTVMKRCRERDKRAQCRDRVLVGRARVDGQRRHFKDTRHTGGHITDVRCLPVVVHRTHRRHLFHIARCAQTKIVDLFLNRAQDIRRQSVHFGVLRSSPCPAPTPPCPPHRLAHLPWCTHARACVRASERTCASERGSEEFVAATVALPYEWAYGMPDKPRKEMCR